MKTSIKTTAYSEQVKQGLSEANDYAKAIGIDDVKSGEWFVSLLTKVAKTYEQNVRAEYFQQKYPGLTPDEIADILIDVTVKYSTIAGGIAGAAVTANQIALFSSAGATAAIMAGTIGGEIIYLARLQMRLVLDLSVIYDINLDSDDPEDILLVFGYALGIVPTEVLGKSLQKAAAISTQQIIRKYISSGTLKTIQAFGKQIGIKILQRTIIKYSVPVVSAAVGSSYNYFTTRSIGKIAKSHLKNRGKVTEELRQLITKRTKYDTVFPAAVLFMSYADGRITSEEKEFYKSVLSRLKLEEYEQGEFNNLLKSKESLLNGLKVIEDTEIKESLVRILSLMAIVDGDFHKDEKLLLTDIADSLGVKLNIKKIEEEAKDYDNLVEERWYSEITNSIKGAGDSIKGFFNNPLA